MGKIQEMAIDLADAVVPRVASSDVAKFDPELITGIETIIAAILAIIAERCDDSKQAARVCSDRRSGLARRIARREARKVFGRDESRRFIADVADELVQMGTSETTIDDGMRDLPK